MATTPVRTGEWMTLDVEFSHAATHAALLPNGKVFVYGGSSLKKERFDSPTDFPAEILDLSGPGGPSVTKVPIGDMKGDIWCGGHTLLKDGKLLFVGGTSYYPPPPDPFYGGLRKAFLYDPFTESEPWTELPEMHEGRWYPTLVRLQDDRVLAVSGFKYRSKDQQNAPKGTFRAFIKILAHALCQIAVDHEVYDPATRKWEYIEPAFVLPLYPRMHLLPDGNIFYSGVFNTHYFTPGDYPSAVWDTNTWKWTKVGGEHFDRSREEGISVLLALRPSEAFKPEVVVIGGGAHNIGRMLMSAAHGSYIGWMAKLAAKFVKVKDSVERIDLSEDDPRWTTGSPMHDPRIHATGVLLPTGHVLAVGGMSKYGHEMVDGKEHEKYPVLSAELYDPDADVWTVMASQKFARVYHSTALLLPDGRVISMGGNPHKDMIETKIEVFSPPYLFKGGRPIIEHAPDEMQLGREYTIGFSSRRGVSQVVLMKPDVVTHVTNTDQRLLELQIVSNENGSITVEGPKCSAHMTRGYVMLFLIDSDGAPSVAQIIQVK